MPDGRGIEAVVVSGPGDIALQTRAAKPLRATDVRVDVLYAGICHTDLFIVHGGHPGAQYPVVPGHEFSGVVREVGPAVTSVKRGDQVAVMTNLPSEDGTPNRQIGTSEDGGWQEEVVLPATSLLRLADVGITAAEAAVLEPAANAVAAVRAANVTNDDHVVVIGPGAIGQCVAQVARAVGARSVSVVGLPRDTVKLAIAESLGATVACTTDDTALSEFEARRIVGLLPARRADVVIECAGAIGATRLGLALVADGGRVIVEGYSGQPSRTVEVSPDEFNVRQLTLRGVKSWTPADFANALRLTREEKIHLEPIITHTFPLSEFKAAIDVFADYRENVLRALLRPMPMGPAEMRPPRK